MRVNYFLQTDDTMCFSTHDIADCDDYIIIVWSDNSMFIVIRVSHTFVHNYNIVNGWNFDQTRRTAHMRHVASWRGIAGGKIQ